MVGYTYWLHQWLHQCSQPHNLEALCIKGFRDGKIWWLHLATPGVATLSALQPCGFKDSRKGLWLHFPTEYIYIEREKNFFAWSVPRRFFLRAIDNIYVSEGVATHIYFYLLSRMALGFEAWLHQCSQEVFPSPLSRTALRRNAIRGWLHHGVARCSQPLFPKISFVTLGSRHRKHF